MSRRRKSSGFTLIELVVATALSSVVLMGMFSILSNMVSAEVNGMRNGTVTAWSLAGISVMNADISGAGALSYPAAGGAGADELVVCTNWSTRTNPPAVVQSAAQGGTGNKVNYYCWDTTDASPSPFANALLRMSVPHGAGAEACPAGAPPFPCTAAGYGTDSIVATGVYRNAGNPIFYTDPNTLNAVRIRFVVGNPAVGAVSMGGNDKTVTPVPVSIPFNTEIILED